MKTKTMLPALAVVLLVLRTVAADDPAVYGSTTNYYHSDNAPLTRNMMGEHLGRTSKASEVLGVSLKNYQGDNVGRLKDLAVDIEAGRIVLALVSVGGVMGLGGTVGAVPPGMLHQDASNNVIHLDVTRAQLDAARFDMNNWGESTGTNAVAGVYSRYGQEPYFLTPESQGDTNLMTPKQLDLMNKNEPMRHAGWHMGYVERASKVIGLPVSNLQGEKLGKVENLVIDLPAGRVVAVVISSGGYLGMNGELSAVPSSAFRYNGETNGLNLDVSKEMLNQAPHFSSSQWPDLDAASTVNIYHAYSVQPYFDTNVLHDADNTARNQRDRHGATLTPFDQGNSSADIATTAQIRKGIMSHSELSTNAKNVKIITRDGKVTLRGPVNTTGEKEKISEIADLVAGGDNVDNQLEVKNYSGN